MKKHKRRRASRHLKRTHILTVAILGLLLLGVSYVYFNNNSEKPATPITTPSNNGQTVNLNPATPEEKKATEDYKKNLSQSPPSAPTTANGKKQVYPVITSASHTEINAYISGVIEDGGNCKATATKGSQIVSASSTGFANVSSTNCNPIAINLPAGNWSVVVSYSSASSEGQSQASGVN